MQITSNILNQFTYYKQLGDKSLLLLSEAHIHQKNSESDNSIADIIKHLNGNMLSRWTNFLNEDGEKSWREREEEFTSSTLSKEEIIQLWEEGWKCVFTAIEPLSDTDLTRIVYIRNQGHTVLEAMIRQIAHYSYHVGQLVFHSKSLVGKKWMPLSIPKGESKSHNDAMFSKEKNVEHFTKNLLDKK